MRCWVAMRLHPRHPRLIRGGITGQITRFFKWLALIRIRWWIWNIRGGCALACLRQTLTDPEKGFIVGNQLYLEMDVVTTLYRSEFDSSGGDELYAGHYTDPHWMMPPSIIITSDNENKQWMQLGMMEQAYSTRTRLTRSGAHGRHDWVVCVAIIHPGQPGDYRHLLPDGSLCCPGASLYSRRNDLLADR